MSKKAQAGPVGFLFLVIVFIVIWALWLGKWLNDTGEIIIASSGATGFEAFFWANLNMWVMIGLILGMIGFFYFGGRQ